MGRKPDLSLQKKTEILTLLKNSDYSFSQIAEISGVGRRSVARIAQREKENIAIGANNRSKCGSKKKTSARLERSIIRTVKKNRSASLREIKEKLEDQGLQISSRTLRRRIVDHGFRCRRPTKKPILDNRKQKKRRSFVRSYENFSLDDWKKVITCIEPSKLPKYNLILNKLINKKNILQKRFFSLTKARCMFWVHQQNWFEETKMKHLTQAA